MIGVNRLNSAKVIQETEKTVSIYCRNDQIRIRHHQFLNRSKKQSRIFKMLDDFSGQYYIIFSATDLRMAYIFRVVAVSRRESVTLKPFDAVKVRINAN
jgi:hypothetical protein